MRIYDDQGIKPPTVFTTILLNRILHYRKMSTPKGPFTLVTVNTAPERAKRLIGRLIEALKDRYTITHVDNCESMYYSL